MDSRNRYDGLDPQAIRTVRTHARRLARRGAMPGMDTEDYEQELMLDLHRRLRRLRERAIAAGFGIFFAVPLRRFPKAAGI